MPWTLGNEYLSSGNMSNKLGKIFHFQAYIRLVLTIRNLMECILVKGQGGKCKKLILKGSEL